MKIRDGLLILLTTGILHQAAVQGAWYDFRKNDVGKLVKEISRPANLIDRYSGMTLYNRIGAYRSVTYMDYNDDGLGENDAIAIDRFDKSGVEFFKITSFLGFPFYESWECEECRDIEEENKYDRHDAV